MPLEQAADALIYAEVRKIKKHSENDILTPWKDKARRKHEIYVNAGVPDPANRLGIYHRAANAARPDLNSREGWSRNTMWAPGTTSTSGLAEFVADEDNYDA
jgi:hypothetical protein